MCLGSMALKILRLISTVSNPAVKALIGSEFAPLGDVIWSLLFFSSNVSSIATKLILSGSPVQAKFSVLAISSACLHPGKVVAKIVPVRLYFAFLRDSFARAFLSRSRSLVN